MTLTTDGFVNAFRFNNIVSSERKPILRTNELKIFIEDYDIVFLLEFWVSFTEKRYCLVPEKKVHNHITIMHRVMGEGALFRRQRRIFWDTRY